MKRNHTISLNANIRILKAGGCPSLSGKSKLRYEIGCTAEGALQVRICGNSGTGYFNDDWIEWSGLGAVLERHGNAPITSATLSPLFKGRSANSGGFLLAALKQEGLVQRIEGNSRSYERLDGSRFAAEIASLIDAPVTPGKAAKGVKAVSGKTPASEKPRAGKR